MAQELKEFFPGENITGLVVRRRKSSSASIEIEEQALPDYISTNRRRGSSIDEISDDLEDIDQVIAKSFRRRGDTGGTISSFRTKCKQNG